MNEVRRAGLHVVESSVVGKSSDDASCEDALVLSQWFVGVVDGATDVTGHRYGGRTGGRLAAEVLVHAAHLLDPDVDVVGAVDALSAALAAEMPAVRADGPSAAITLVSARRREVWQIGDVAWWLIEGAELSAPPSKLVDVVTGDIRANALEALLAEGAGVADLLARDPDPGRTAAEPVLRAQAVLRNASGPSAYGAIDGRPVPAALVSVTALPEHEVELVVASDGYPRPGRTLAEAEAELARLLKEDPLCIGPLRGAKGVRPGHLSFDDRAYVRLRLPAAVPGRDGPPADPSGETLAEV